MFRQVFKNFYFLDRFLKIISRESDGRLKPFLSIYSQQMMHGETTYKTSKPSENLNINDDISDPIDAESLSSLKFQTKAVLISKYKQLLGCTHEEALNLADSHKTLKFNVKHITNLTSFMLNNKFPADSIIENPWLFGMNTELLKTKMGLLDEMEPRCFADLVPLLKVSVPKLNKILKVIKREAPFIPGGNRIYYTSDMLKVEPKIVSSYFSTHTFMFDISFGNLSESLNIFIDFKVAPMNLLKDLWAFKYNPKSIVTRLERARAAQKDKIMPWMVRCPEEVLEKTLQLSLESRALLGENESVLDYLSERLGYDLETIKYITMKHPAVLKVRVPKIKEILDYLLNEAGFTTHHIAQVPRILCHSLETTKYRLNELKLVGCIPSSLVIVCKSQREYQKFLNSWIDIRNKNKLKNIV